MFKILVEKEGVYREKKVKLKGTSAENSKKRFLC